MTTHQLSNMMDSNMQRDKIHNDDNNNNGSPTQTNNKLMVCVRVKPLHDEGSIIKIFDDKTLVFDPIQSKQTDTDVHSYHGRQFKSIGTQRNKNFIYSFDRIFDDNSTNLSIHETVTLPMVDTLIDGDNCCVFAYGATGSGKTYTMLGEPNNPGVIYHTAKSLYGRLSEISEIDPLPAELKICYLEIYSEKSRDLLKLEPNNSIKYGNKRLRTMHGPCSPRNAAQAACNLSVDEPSDDSQSLVITDLTYHSPKNAERLMDLLEAGNANRSQHPTDANADSSRSHAIFQIVLTRRTRRIQGDSPDPQYELQSSKMSLIDLAGSEQATVSNHPREDCSKDLQSQGGSIEHSLLALGSCLNALAENSRGGRRHVPYGDSILTRLLEGSLGGRCRTAMIATIRQQHTHYNDTQKTLIYASRATCVKTGNGRNFTKINSQPDNSSIRIENQSEQISTLQSQNEHLKVKIGNFQAENEDLRRTLNRLINRQEAMAPNRRSHTDRTSSPSERPTASNSLLITLRFGPKLVALYDELQEIRMKVGNYKSNIFLARSFEHRIDRLQNTLERLDESRLKRDSGCGQMELNGNSTTSVTNCDIDTIAGAIIENSQALRSVLNFYDRERISLSRRSSGLMNEIGNTIARMSNKLGCLGDETRQELPEIIDDFIKEREKILGKMQKKSHVKHGYLSPQQTLERPLATNNLLNEAANIIRGTQAIAEEGGLSTELKIKLADFLKKLEDRKSVIYLDDSSEMEDSSCSAISGIVPLDRQVSKISVEGELNFEVQYGVVTKYLPTSSAQSEPGGVCASSEKVPIRKQQVKTHSPEEIRANSAASKKPTRASILATFVRNRIPCRDPDRQGQFLDAMKPQYIRGCSLTKDNSFEPSLYRIYKILGYLCTCNRRLMFCCETLKSRELSRRWIDYDHVVEMEPKGKFIDYIRSLYVFNQVIYKNMFKHILRTHGNADNLKNLVGKGVEQVYEDGIKKAREELKRHSMAKENRT